MKKILCLWFATLGLFLSSNIVLANSNPKKVNVIEMAEAFGFKSVNDILAYEKKVNYYKGRKEALLDENFHDAMIKLRNILKDFDFNNFEPRGHKAFQYAQRFREIKYSVNQYFVEREKVLSFIGKENQKFDIYALLNKYKLPTDNDHLYKFFGDFYSPTNEMLNDHKLYSRMSELHAELEGRKMSDFNRSDQKRRKIVQTAIEGTNGAVEHYLSEYEAIAEQKKRAKREKKLEEKRKQEAPKNLVHKFRSSKKPKMFRELKYMLSSVDLWQVLAELPKYNNSWRISVLDNRRENENLVFDNPPLNPSAYRSKHLIIHAKISSRIGGNYIIKPYNNYSEAIAVISEELISKTNPRFGQTLVLLCAIKDVVEVQTVIGSTKIVTVVQVDEMVPLEQYNQFARYVAGHPSEFEASRYVKIRVN